MFYWFSWLNTLGSLAGLALIVFLVYWFFRPASKGSPDPTGQGAAGGATEEDGSPPPESARRLMSAAQQAPEHGPAPMPDGALVEVSDPGPPSRRHSRHHYALAHHALRQYCQSNPGRFFQVLASPVKAAFLADIWRSVCEHIPDEAPTFSMGEVKVDALNILGRPAVLVQMPPPSDTTEAHFVAVVLDWQVQAGPPPDGGAAHYFTLERGTNMDGTTRTFLCGWDGDTHYNTGEDLPPIVSLFIQAVERHLGSKPN